MRIKPQNFLAFYFQPWETAGGGLQAVEELAGLD